MAKPVMDEENVPHADGPLAKKISHGKKSRKGKGKKKGHGKKRVAK